MKNSEPQNVKAAAIWYKGSTVLGNKTSGVMALEDNNFTFTDEDGKNVLELPVSQIKAFTVSQKTVGLKTISKQPYKLYFTFAQGKNLRTVLSGSGGVLGLTAGMHSQYKAGVKDWITAFATRDVPTKNYAKSALMIFIAIVLVAAVIVLLVDFA